MAEVTILCKRTVVSTKPVEPGKFYNLSVLDHIMEHSNLRLVFYYPTPPEIELGKATRKLCESLSEMLTSFAPVTGRLQKTPEGHWRIKCNDAGVRVYEARATGSVDEWLQKADSKQELKLVYWEDMYHKPYFWSTSYIQFTEFEGGGLAIGVSCIHLLADATCLTMLVKAWADTTLIGKMFSPPHFHPLPPRRIGNKDINHKPYTDLINYYRASLESPGKSMISCTERFATVTFAFTDEMVRRCMTEAQTGGGGNILDNSSSSPFAALASLFWLSISRVKGKRGALVDMSICLDGRKALGLDKGFFGNCMFLNKVSGDNLEEVGLMSATNAIENVIGKMGSEGIMDLVEWLECNKNKCSQIEHKPSPPTNGPNLICANWENLDPYSAIFESRVRPIHVSYYLEHVFGEGQVFILPSPDANRSLSRVVMVTLPEAEVEKLCIEDLVLRFSPAIVMGVKQNEY